MTILKKLAKFTFDACNKTKPLLHYGGKFVQRFFSVSPNGAPLASLRRFIILHLNSHLYIYVEKAEEF